MTKIYIGNLNYDTTAETLKDAFGVAAGAINEIEPGNPAVFRILAMCRNQ